MFFSWIYLLIKKCFYIKKIVKNKLHFFFAFVFVFLFFGVYKDFVISGDGKTSGILVYIKPDKKLIELIETKNDYLDRKSKGQLTSKEKRAYKSFLKEYDGYKKSYNKKNHKNQQSHSLHPKQKAPAN